MTEKTELQMQEDIELGTESKTITFPVRVRMTSLDGNFEFISSVDEHGNLVLTPSSESSEFTDAHTEWESSDYIMPTETVQEGSVKEFTISITANLLMDVPSEALFVGIDKIGQCVIYPQEGNTIVSASVNDSLNLVTESANTESVDLQEVISRFLMGETGLFTYVGQPENHWTPVPELNNTHYTAYYDVESDSIIFQTSENS